MIFLFCILECLFIYHSVGNVPIMARLIELGVPVNHANKKGDTALIRAAWKGEVFCFIPHTLFVTYLFS